MEGLAGLMRSESQGKTHKLNKIRVPPEGLEIPVRSGKHGKITGSM
jgi:hypothetical protein